MRDVATILVGDPVLVRTIDPVTGKALRLSEGVLDGYTDRSVVVRLPHGMTFTVDFSSPVFDVTDVHENPLGRVDEERLPVTVPDLE